jgi:hypothetical protein
MNRQYAYEYRARHPDFGERWEEAEADARDALELEARRRAIHGVERPLIARGEVIGLWYDPAGNVVPKGTPGARFVPQTVREYSDALLALLLRGHFPDRYRDRQVEHRHGGNGQPIRHTVAATAPDYSNLSTEQLLQLQELLRLARGGPAAGRGEVIEGNPPALPPPSQDCQEGGEIT